jgi:putative membrane protein
MNKARMWKRYLGVPLLAALMGMGSAYAQSLAKADEKALKDMAIANMAEVETARIALDKSRNAEVKAFAQQMIDDHTKGLDEVKSVAQAKNVTLPSEPDAKHKAMAKKLQAMSGEKFDKAYLEMAGVKSHKEAHALVVKTQSNAKDNDVKALAAKLQPTIDQHMGHVDQLAANVKGMKSGTAMGSSSTGSTGSSMPAGKDKISTQQQSSGNTDNPKNPANPTTTPSK